MAKREDLAFVTSARRELERAQERLSDRMRLNSSNTQRHAAERDVLNAEKRLEAAIVQQTTHFGVSEKQEALAAEFQKGVSERIKLEYLVEHPDCSNDQYERIRSQVEELHAEKSISVGVEKVKRSSRTYSSAL